MKLTVKIISVLIVLSLASPVILLKGCGKSLNGGQCGGCPDSTAPFGSTIKAPASLGDPSAATGTCYPTLSFQVLGSDGNPLNDICIELFTDGASAIAKSTGLPGDCWANVNANGKSSMITRTNSSGAVVVDFGVPSSTAGAIFFVEAVSCTINATATTPASL